MEPVIQTFTGKKFNPLEPDPALICIEDIAHALALKCRYTGHCTVFYPVGLHCLYAAEMVWGMGCTPLTALGALLHDAEEAYLPDFAAPIKDKFWYSQEMRQPKAIFKIEVKHLGRKVRLAIFEAFGLDYHQVDWELVKNVDLRMLATEREHIMTPGFVWDGLAGVEPFTGLTIAQEMPWKRVEEDYKSEFRYLMGMLGL